MTAKPSHERATPPAGRGEALLADDPLRGAVPLVPAALER
jgi:hypothetical protein